MDVEYLLSLIGSIYAAGLDSHRWSDLLVAIAELCGTETASLVMNDARIGVSSVTAPRVDPEIIARYTDGWWEQDPTAITTAAVPVGVLTTLETTGRETFLESPFHNEFWRGSGLGADRVATNLALGEGAFASCVLHAGTKSDEITAETLTRFSMVAPHLVRAVEIQRRLWRLEIQQLIVRAGGIAAQDGVAVVDAATRAILVDPSAERLFALREGPRLQNGTVVLGEPAATARLHRLVAACVAPRIGTVAGGIMALGETLSLTVLPVSEETALVTRYDLARRRPAALIMFTDEVARERRRRDALQHRFGLTAAEAALTLEIVRGGGRSGVADRLGISLSTARTHLSRIYQKTDTTRQAELVKLVVELELTH